MKINNFYYKIVGLEYMTFDTLNAARRIGREWLAFDRPLSGKIRGGGCRIMRVNIANNKVSYYNI